MNLFADQQIFVRCKPDRNLQLHITSFSHHPSTLQIRFRFPPFIWTTKESGMYARCQNVYKAGEGSSRDPGLLITAKL